MLDQRSDETFVRAERRAMNTDRNLVGVVAVLVAKFKSARPGAIGLARHYRKLASDHTPRWHIKLRPVKRRFVRHFDVVNPRVFQNVARHLFGLFPKLRFIDELLAEL